METPKNNLSRLRFPRDDYDEINSEYFSEILSSGSWLALPAGWHNPHSDAALQFKVHSVEKSDTIRYALDEGRALGERKSCVLKMLSDWEGRTVGWDEITLCPSVSTANLLVLSAIRARGLRSVLFEAPAYYATIAQAEMLDLEVLRIFNTTPSDFDVNPAEIRDSLPEAPCAIWLTHPRYGVGTNQSVERIQAISEVARRGDVIVIDEAAEQMFPSTLCKLDQIKCEFVRTRGLVKGIGLNGLRLAAVLHPPKWRAGIQEFLEAVGASLDAFSLANFNSLALTPSFLPALLATANRQVVRHRQRVESLTRGSWATPTPLANGYIGSLLLDFSRLPGTYESKRVSLLQYCKKRRVPIVLGASIGFPQVDTFEAVRLNYFTSLENVEVSAQVLIEAYHQLSNLDSLGNSGGERAHL